MLTRWVRDNYGSNIFQNDFGPNNGNIFKHLLKVSYFSFQQARWKDFSQDTLHSHNRNCQGFEVLSEHRHHESPLADEAIITVFGHSAAMIRYEGRSFLFDPIWSPCAGPYGLLGVKRKRSIMPLERLHHPNYVLISHDHYDHLDIPTLKKIQARGNTVFICGLGVGAIINQVLPNAQVIELKWWESHQTHTEKITFVPAQHFSGRSLRMNHTLWGGFIVETAKYCFYYPGDTGYQEKILATVKQRFPFIHLALLPIGSYEPYHQLKHYHLSPGDALAMQRYLDIPLAVAVHFGSFQLSLETAEHQVAEFLRAHQEHTADRHSFVLPVFGLDYLAKLRR